MFYMKALELKSQQFGKLFVLDEAGYDRKGNILWECLCDCSKSTTVRGYHLKSGHTKSCGCLLKNCHITHGKARTPEYRIWESMIQRCNNPKDTAYHNYGKRGIQVCKEWLSFINFFKDMGERPEGLTIERCDNSLGYFKENCKWETRFKQSQNQRMRNDNTTGIRGVVWHKQCQKYQARIMIEGKNYNIGIFETREQAAVARRNAELQYWG